MDRGRGSATAALIEFPSLRLASEFDRASHPDVCLRIPAANRVRGDSGDGIAVLEARSAGWTRHPPIEERTDVTKLHGSARAFLLFERPLLDSQVNLLEIIDADVLSGFSRVVEIRREGDSAKQRQDAGDNHDFHQGEPRLNLGDCAGGWNVCATPHRAIPTCPKKAVRNNSKIYGCGLRVYPTTADFGIAVPFWILCPMQTTPGGPEMWEYSY